jgi:hypothetical protein
MQNPYGNWLTSLSHDLGCTVAPHMLDEDIRTLQLFVQVELVRQEFLWPNTPGHFAFENWEHGISAVGSLFWV